jgi:hypothetical protein
MIVVMFTAVALVTVAIAVGLRSIRSRDFCLFGPIRGALGTAPRSEDSEDKGGSNQESGIDEVHARLPVEWMGKNHGKDEVTE